MLKYSELTQFYKATLSKVRDSELRFKCYFEVCENFILVFERLVGVGFHQRIDN